jgi:hypothetical protein
MWSLLARMEDFTDRLPLPLWSRRKPLAWNDCSGLRCLGSRPARGANWRGIPFASLQAVIGNGK